MSVRFFYLHGFNSGFDRNDPKIQSLSSVAPIRGFNCNYMDPDSILAISNEIADQASSSDGELILVGTSLGGYFARYFADLFGLRCIVINPSMRPYETLLRSVGENTNFKSGETYKVTGDQVRWLEVYSCYYARIPSLTILATDDDVIDYREAYDLLQHRSDVVLTTGGHRLSNINSDLLDRITKFVNQVPVDPIDHENSSTSC